MEQARKARPRRFYSLRQTAAIEAIAAEKGSKPSQLARRWLLAQGESIVPIPGTKRRTYLEENLGALDMELTAEELGRIGDVSPRGAASGPRYSAAFMRFIQSVS